DRRAYSSRRHRDRRRRQARSNAPGSAPARPANLRHAFMSGLIKLCEHLGGLLGFIGLLRDVPLAHGVDADNRRPAPLASLMRDTLRDVVMVVRRLYFTWVWQMDIGEGTGISLRAKLDQTHPAR